MSWEQNHISHSSSWKDRGLNNEACSAVYWTLCRIHCSDDFLIQTKHTENARTATTTHFRFNEKVSEQKRRMILLFSSLLTLHFLFNRRKCEELRQPPTPARLCPHHTAGGGCRKRGLSTEYRSGPNVLMNRLQIYSHTELFRCSSSVTAL